MNTEPEKFDYNRTASFKVRRDEENLGSFTCTFNDCYKQIADLLNKAGYSNNIIEGQKAMQLALHGHFSDFGILRNSFDPDRDFDWKPRPNGNWNTYWWTDNKKKRHWITVVYLIVNESKKN